MYKLKSKQVFCAITIILSAISADAALYYTPSEYNAVYNEKIALQLELKTLNRQFQNEKKKYEATISELNSVIDGLKRDIAQLKNTNAEQKKSCDSKTDELQKMIDMLKEKGSETEKNLVESNRLLQKKCEDDMAAAREQWNKEREKLLEEIKTLKAGYEQKIQALKDTIANLQEELSDLKKLSDQQKKELAKMESQASELEKQLDEEIKKGDIRLKKFHNRLVINIDDRISFDSGYANLKKDVMPALVKIREILSQYPDYNIVVEGHTDNVPMRSKKFRDNWQLSTERALAVLDYLLQDKDLNPLRFSAAGYGEYRPLVPNDTAENRALNRRVDIVVIPAVLGQ